MLGKRSRGKTSKNCIRKTGDILSGNLSMNGNLIKNVGDPVDAGDAVNRKYIDTNFVTKIYRSTTNNGDIDMNNFNYNLDYTVSNKMYIDDNFLNLHGGTVNDNLDMQKNAVLLEL